MENATSVHDSSDDPGRPLGPRHSILDLAPLELECLSALWPMGEGTVRDIQRELNVVRPRAYTTILTIMDRLAQKGIVARRRVGRAYWYQANLSADEARMNAVEKIVAGFFDGSTEALAAHLSAQISKPRIFKPPNSTPLIADMEAPGAAARNFPHPVPMPAVPVADHAVHDMGPSTGIDAPDIVSGESPQRHLDETLL